MKIFGAMLVIVFTLVGCSTFHNSKPSDMIAHAVNGVVGIEGVEKSATGELSSGLGTGFFIDENVIVTNFHVVEHGTVSLKIFANGQRYLVKYDAEIIEGNKDVDIALIRIKDWDKFKKENPNYKILKWASTPDVGDRVWAIGQPWGLLFSVSHGIVSSSLQVLGDKLPIWWIQTDAHVYNGNSGGPLLNANGDVVGVNSAMIVNTGGSYGFTIPSDLVRKYISDLDKYKEIRWLSIGIVFGENNTIKDVFPGSAGETAGLKPGDKITEFFFGTSYPEEFRTFDFIAKQVTQDYTTLVSFTIVRNDEILLIQVKPDFKRNSDFINDTQQ